jgi:hypothetical protein
MGKGEENICGWRHDKVDKKKGSISKSKFKIKWFWHKHKKVNSKF